MYEWKREYIWGSIYMIKKKFKEGESWKIRHL